MSKFYKMDINYSSRKTVWYRTSLIHLPLLIFSKSVILKAQQSSRKYSLNTLCLASFQQKDKGTDYGQKMTLVPICIHLLSQSHVGHNSHYCSMNIQ